MSVSQSAPMSATAQPKRQLGGMKPSGSAKRSRYSAPDEWNRRTNCSVLRLGTTSAAACPQLILPADAPTATLDADTSLLSASLYPLTVDDFKRDYWRRSAVAIVGAGGARVEQLIADELCGLDVKELMAASASEQIFVWMKERHAAADTSSASSPSALATQPISSFPLDNPNQLDAALTCYNSGSSLYFRSPPALAHRFVRAFNAGVGFNFAGLDYSSTSSTSQPKGEIEVFVSRAGHHTGWHQDFQSNFTIQLRGKKTWTFGDVSVQHPVRGFTPHYKDRSTDELQYKVHSACQSKPYDGEVPASGEQVTLSAGDVLYHPAGIWHAVSCDEDSISINISLVATTTADLISDAVRQLLWRTEAGRAGLCGTVHEMQQQLEQALVNLKQSLGDDQLSAAAILPVAMMAPRRRQPVVIDSQVDKRMLSKDGRRLTLNEVYSVHDTYTFNPLMTITPFRGREEEEEEEDDIDSPIESKEEQKERGSDDEQSEVDEGTHMEQDECAQYALHHLFGNESVDSAMRTVLRVHRSLQPTFDVVIAQREKLAEYVDMSNADDVLAVMRCCFVLCELGFATVRKHAGALLPVGARILTDLGTPGVVTRHTVDGGLQLRLDGQEAVQVSRNVARALRRVAPTKGDAMVVVSDDEFDGKVGSVIGINSKSGECIVNLEGDIEVLLISVLCKYEKPAN